MTIYITTSEDESSGSEGEDGQDLSGDEDQDLQDQFDDPIDDSGDGDAAKADFDLEGVMTSSETESEPVKIKKN